MMSQIESAGVATAHDRLSAPETERSNGFIVVISGPSGVGKDTAAAGLLTDRSLGLDKLVTYTTRPQRPGEVEGVDYHFVSPAQFERLDLAEKKEYRPGEWKGTPKTPFFEVLDAGRKLLWRIDPSRAANLKNFYQEKFEEEMGRKLFERTLVIYLGVPRLSVLYHRVRQREGVKFDKASFMQTLQAEDFPQWRENEASFPHVVMNDGTVEETVGEIVSLIKTSFSLAPSDI